MWSDKNNLSADQTLPNTTMAFWTCPTCHGDYPARINKVINGKVECPYCNNKKVLPGFNSLAVKYPIGVEIMYRAKLIISIASPCDIMLLSNEVRKIFKISAGSEIKSRSFTIPSANSSLSIFSFFAAYPIPIYIVRITSLLIIVKNSAIKFPPLN